MSQFNLQPSFLSFEQVITHLSDESVSCGSLLSNHWQGNDLGEELDIAGESNSEGSWEEISVGPFILFLIDFCVVKVSPDGFPFSPFEDIASEQDENVLYNFTPPPPLPPKQYINDYLPSSDSITRHKEYHPNRAKFRQGGENLLQRMDQDLLSEHRKTNVHYPFADCTEWELAQWLNSTSLTQQQIGSFLRLDYVSHLFITSNLNIK